MKPFHGGFNQTNLMLHILVHLFISLVKLKIQHIASHAVIFLGQNVGSAIIYPLKYKMRKGSRGSVQESRQRKKLQITPPEHYGA